MISDLRFRISGIELSDFGFAISDFGDWIAGISNLRFRIAGMISVERFPKSQIQNPK